MTDHPTPLKQALIHRGMTQSTLARLLGVGEAQVSKWSRGAIRPGRANRHRVARVLAVPVEELWPPAETTVDGAV